MPGYVIHIAVAQEYQKKHHCKCSIEFIKGTVAPDFTDDNFEEILKTHKPFISGDNYYIKNCVLFYNNPQIKYNKIMYDELEVKDKSTIHNFGIDGFFIFHIGHSHDGGVVIMVGKLRQALGKPLVGIRIGNYAGIQVAGGFQHILPVEAVLKGGRFQLV